MKRYWLCLGVLLHYPGASTAQSMYRCEQDGRVVFQQAPCEKTAQQQTQIKLPTARVGTVPVQPPPPKAVPEQPRTAEDQSQPRPAQAGNSAPKTAAQRMADQCLDWYRPKLRDPRGAYHGEVSTDRNVVKLTIYATNGYGGYVDRAAACEFKGGDIDQGWTNIQAKRLGWGAP